MKYLSIDIESTGLEEKSLIIEFAAVPFDTEARDMSNTPIFYCHIWCPSFTELEPTLSPWIKENNKSIIDTAHDFGLSLEAFKSQFQDYLNRPDVKAYFNNEKPTLFGKSLSGIDLPYLTRDLGWEFMRKNFSHRTMDLSSVAGFVKDNNLVPGLKDNSSNSLMKYFNMGKVEHRAFKDAINTAIMYCTLLDETKAKK